MSDSGGAGQGGGSPTLAGKLVVPDLSSMSEVQKENVEAVSSVSKEMSGALQKIVSEQQSALKAVLEGLQTSIEESSGQGGIPSSKIPDLAVSVDALKISTDSFAATSEKLTGAATKSHDMLIQSINKSMAKIEETAKKFSGG